ncbi:extracellular solute-binding protein [Alcanivorax quisquiliarum]|uniref:Extracellular solute-binding protein n=1 Tax=Alcanivorax quisquiliarum TaxID=2933565 RepID=A0ABT0EAJ8_9GAMM|nr:extracellular solute-binding protein [Alcanivorax quisquiliarum]MCK0538619.1 extracellular solute-binding protein [Alcanivorax quisquiliarum]
MKTFLRRHRLVPVINDALTVYAAGPGALARQLVADYMTATGVPVNLVQGTTGRLLARLEAEASAPVADVLILASWDAALELERAQRLLPLSVAGAQQLPAGLRTECLLAQAVSVLGLAWREGAPGTPPDDWQGLLAPSLQQRVIMPDPAQSGATLDLLLGLDRAWGESLWALLAHLRATGMVVAGSNSQALTQLLRGEHDVVFGCVDYLARARQADGAALRFILPRTGTVSAARPMMVLKGARHAAQAQDFLAHVIGAPAQQRVSAAGLLPVWREGDDSPPWPASLPALQSVSPVLHNTARRALLARFAALFDAPYGDIPLGWA